ncbi:MAG: hypothetical protein WD826_07885 [Actinomycetota bacterium]
MGGLVGAGRTELVRAIIGADPRTGGTATLNVDGDTFVVPLTGSDRRISANGR